MTVGQPGRRLLYIAHGFPPAAGSGAHRALAFARYLPSYGWLPTVITPGQAWAAPSDASLLTRLPAGVRVVRTRSWERRPTAPTMPIRGPQATARQPSRLRAQLGHLARFPDAHRGWVPFAVAAGLRVLRQERSAVIYSTAGPFSSHVVGLLLHRLSRRPWLAELRDGWYRWNRAIFPDYPVWRDGLERRLEAAVVHEAARLVLVTRPMADAFRGQFPDLPAAHFEVIPNGFEPGDVSSIGAEPRHADDFRVVYAGSLYRGRSILPVLDAALTLGRADPAFAASLRLTVLGSQDEQASAELTGHPLAADVKLRGQLDHASTMTEIAAADLLLLLVNTTPGAAAAVPAKLFEYLAAGRPILAIAPPASEAGAIVTEAGAGWVAQADRPEQVVAALGAAWQARRDDALPVPRAEVVERFDRRTLAGDLARLLDAVVAEGRPVRSLGG